MKKYTERSKRMQDLFQDSAQVCFHTALSKHLKNIEIYSRIDSLMIQRTLTHLEDF